MTSKKADQPKEIVYPQLTFTESELRDVVDFMNFMQTQTGGNVPLDKMGEYNKLSKGMVDHLRKVESHIMEIKKVTQARAK